MPTLSSSPNLPARLGSHVDARLRKGDEEHSLALAGSVGFAGAQARPAADSVAEGTRKIVQGVQETTKDLGKIRLEGKDYVVADGDVIEFRFNV